MAKQMSKQAELLQKHKKAKIGKRVRLEGVSIYTIADVLCIAREEETQVKIKKPRGRPHKVIIIESSNEEEDEVSEELIDSLDEEPVVCTQRAVFSHIEV
jgi:hypothetical protein